MKRPSITACRRIINRRTPSISTARRNFTAPAEFISSPSISSRLSKIILEVIWLEFQDIYVWYKEINDRWRATGRYHEGYSESGGYGQYDATPFQTVPGSGSGGGGGGVGGDQWGVGPLEHLSHHPAFLAGLGPRDSSNPHHPSSIGNNPDQKPLLQSAMIPGYTSNDRLLWKTSLID